MGACSSKHPDSVINLPPFDEKIQPSKVANLLLEHSVLAQGTDLVTSIYMALPVLSAARNPNGSPAALSLLDIGGSTMALKPSIWPYFQGKKVHILSPEDMDKPEFTNPEPNTPNVFVTTKKIDELKTSEWLAPEHKFDLIIVSMKYLTRISADKLEELLQGLVAQLTDSGQLLLDYINLESNKMYAPSIKFNELKDLFVPTIKDSESMEAFCKKLNLKYTRTGYKMELRAEEMNQVIEVYRYYVLVIYFQEKARNLSPIQGVRFNDIIIDPFKEMKKEGGFFKFEINFDIFKITK